MLTLPIKRVWFEMILRGEKKEEYRSLSKHYERFFRHVADGKTEFRCILRNGYGLARPSVIIDCVCETGFGREEWGAEKNVRYYVLKILRVAALEDWHASEAAPPPAVTALTLNSWKGPRNDHRHRKRT